jgi:hypothetical protein
LRLIACSAGFVLLSYAPLLAPRNAARLPGLMIFWSFFCTTAIILCDEAANRLEQRSLISEVTLSRGRFFEFVAAATISGLLLDGVAQWVGKLWIYPYWTKGLYVSTFVLGFCAYWLLLTETFLLGRALLRVLARSLRRQAPPPWIARALRGSALCGGVLTISGLALAARGYDSAGGYYFEISLPSKPHVPFACFPLIFVGAWLILEFLQHRRGRDSLLSSILRGEWITLASVLLPAWIFGLFMETVNTAGHFWRYTNWPLQPYTVLGVPVVVLLLWPLQYVVFLSVYQVVSGTGLLDTRRTDV